MGKKRQVVEGRSREERVTQRKQLGSLRSLAVQPATKKRSEAALSKFFDFLKFEGITLPKKKLALDDLVSEYVEHLWSSGEGRALASDTLAGLQNLDPHLKGSLVGSWRLLKVWNQNEIPNRAPPIPETVLHALVGRALLLDDSRFALSLLLGFYGMLRSGEILGLKPQQVEAPSDDGPAIISLGMTKTAKRQGAAESVTITVQEVVRRLRQWKQSSDLILVGPAQSWRTKFSEYLTALNLDSFQFRPYSLRRGGATFWFGKHGSFDRLLVQGRWQAPKTARIYINSGLATLAEMNVPVKKLRGFQSIYRKSISQPLPTLERTRKASSSGGRGKTRRRCGPKTHFCAIEGESDRAESPKCVVLESSSISGMAEVAGGVPQGVSRPDFAPGLADEIGGIPYGSFLTMIFLWGHVF